MSVVDDRAEPQLDEVYSVYCGCPHVSRGGRQHERAHAGDCDLCLDIKSNRYILCRTPNFDLDEPHPRLLDAPIYNRAMSRPQTPFRRQSPEQASARRAHQARCERIRAGLAPGLIEKDTKKIRPEIRALIDEALAKRAVAGEKLDTNVDPDPGDLAEFPKFGVW